MRNAIGTTVTLVTFCFACTLAAMSSAEYSVTDIVDAAKRGDGHAVHKLIELDPSLVAARDDHGYTPLHWAAIRGHWRIVTELCSMRAPIRTSATSGAAHHCTSLHVAAVPRSLSC
jgi:glutamine phosphoribosylpyrophosphate amidotransferase